MLLLGWPWLVPFTLIPGFAFIAAGAPEIALATIFGPIAVGLNPLLNQFLFESLFAVGILTFLFGVA